LITQQIEKGEDYFDSWPASVAFACQQGGGEPAPDAFPQAADCAQGVLEYAAMAM
tara:strand:+ start:210 stop:374 length:165 start_codon:yes stop_codon:yes gene_type:complete